MSLSEKNRRRLEAGERNPVGFAAGFEVGRVAVEYENDNNEIYRARKYMGRVMTLGYDMGVQVISVAKQFERELEESAMGVEHV